MIAALCRRRVRVGDVTPSGVEPFFAETFPGGEAAGGGDFTWAPQSAWDVVANEDAETGYCWRGVFGPDALNENGIQSGGNLQFNLGRDCLVFAAEWRLWVPSNYAHRDNGPGVGENNKWFGLFRDSINNNEAWRMVLEVDQSGTDGSISAPKAAEPNSGEQVVFYQQGTGVNLVNLTGALVNKGAFNTMRVLVKSSSADNVRDGVLKWWVNGTLLDGGVTNGDFWSWNRTTYPDGAAVNLGYFMGSQNSGYTNETIFYVDAPKFYDSDPGWT